MKHSKEETDLKNSSTVKNQKLTYKIVLPVIILIAAILNQGGYYGGAVVFCGILISLSLPFFGFRFKKKYIPLAVFGLWYAFCSVKSGFTVEYAARGVIPITLLFYLLLVSGLEKNEKELTINIFLKISVFITAIAIFHCIFMSFGKGSLARALFPFQYSNACGIFYGVCYLLCDGITDKFIKNTKYVFLAALILTGSVGAVSVTVLILLITKKSIRYTALVILLCILGAFLFRNRIAESHATFIERLLQIHDGFLCMLKNPVFGIGAGSWENARHFFQSGYYNSAVIHSSIVQIGVNSGFTGLLLFCLSVFYIAKDIAPEKKCFLCMIALILHSFLDFSLSFISLDMLMIILTVGGNGADKKIGKPVKFTLSAAAILIFLSFGVCFSVISSFSETDRDRLIARYENSVILSHSEKITKDYMYALYQKGDYTKINSIIDGMRYPSTEITLLKIKTSTDIDAESDKCLATQPFNLDLLRLCGKDTGNPEMSALGKKLYELKGENK